jgi:eukaryotic-like serine/threonine-protein kinase
VLAGVLKSDPDWRALPAETPEGIRRLLRRCLERDPKKRLQHIGDARLDIDEAPQLAAVAMVPLRSVWRERGAWAAAGLFAVVALWLVLRPRMTPQLPEVRLEIAAPRTPDPISLALSPDGTKIVFAASGEQGVQLWIRSLDSPGAHPLTGTGNGRLPFWSPDSSSIAFFADSRLKRLDLDTGIVRSLTTAVSKDGQRFLIGNAIGDVNNNTAPIAIILNWKPK